MSGKKLKLLKLQLWIYNVVEKMNFNAKINTALEKSFTAMATMIAETGRMKILALCRREVVTLENLSKLFPLT